MKLPMKLLSGIALSTLVAAGGQPVQATTLINGAGATFPYPLYSKWFSDYNKENPKVEINYQSVGSGAGIKQITAKTVNFGASDAPMTNDELQAAPDIVHIPTVIGADVLAYNVPGLKGALKLDPAVLADIFLGKITKWNDPKIVALNAGSTLPDQPIVVVYRSDSSGTTFVFTDYLSKVSEEWKTKVGASKTVKWPVGLGGKGNEGVTGQIKNTPGSIGYIELTYALAEKMPFAQIKNSAGNFVTADMKSVSEAAAGAMKDMPDDMRISITNAGGKDAYPISSFTYLLVYKNTPAPAGPEMAKFLSWALDKSKGQKVAAQMHYAPLPDKMLAKVKDKVKLISK